MKMKIGNREGDLCLCPSFYYAVIYIAEISLLIKMAILTFLLVLKRICTTFLCMFSFKNKFNLLIIVMSFKTQGSCPLKDASVEALRLLAAASLFTQLTVRAKPS